MQVTNQKFKRYSIQSFYLLYTHIIIGFCVHEYEIQLTYDFVEILNKQLTKQLL